MTQILSKKCGLQLVSPVLLLICVAISFGLPLRAQQIETRVLNGHNGKPVMHECLNVWTGIREGAHLVAATNDNGIVALRIEGRDIVAEVACSGWPSRASLSPGTDEITVSGDRYVACQEYGKTAEGEHPVSPLKLMPSYPIGKILESGITSANTCGKLRGDVKPGELVLDVRSRSFWEKMRQ